MNEFYLVNQNNIRFSLRDFQQKSFIPSLKGLGYKHNIDFIQIGNYFKKDYKEVAQGELSGTIVFSSYQHYLDLISFVESADSLRFIYKPIDTEYFRDIEVRGITDTTKSGGLIEAEISFSCKGLYYTENEQIFSVEEIEGESRYDLLFDYLFNDYASADVTFVNDGHDTAEIIVEYYGAITNPKIELYVNNVKTYEVNFNVVIPLGSKLIYCVKDGNNYVVVQNDLGVQTNAISSLDITKDNFFKIPRGTSSIRVSSDTGLSTKVVIKIFTAYKGV
jgi:hypothetical protein